MYVDRQHLENGFKLILSIFKVPNELRGLEALGELQNGGDARKPSSPPGKVPQLLL